MKDITGYLLSILFFFFGLGHSVQAQHKLPTEKDNEKHFLLDSIIFHFSSPPVVGQQVYTIIVTQDTIYKKDHSNTITLELEEELWGDFLPIPSPDTTSAKSEVGLTEIHQEAFEIAYNLFGKQKFGYLDLQPCLGGDTFKLIFKHADKGKKIISWQCHPPKKHEKRIMDFIEILNQSINN